MTPSPLLERHIGLCVAHARTWIEPVLRAAHTCLLTPGHASARGLAREAVAQMVELLQRRGNPLAAAFEQELSRQLRADVAPARAAPDGPTLVGELQLVDEEQAAEEVEVLRTVQLVEGGAEWELRELQARTATLRGQKAIGARSNPLRPELVARSLWFAAATLGVTGGPRRALMRAVGDPLTPAMQQACRDAIAWLSEWGIEPAAWKVASVASGRRPGPPPSGFDVTRPGALDELRAIDSRGAARAPSARSSQEQRLRMAQALLAALDQLPPPGADAAGTPATQWIRSLQRQCAGAARDAAQGDMIETLAALFERMLSDALLLPPVLERLGRLQPTLLRVAVTDQNLFNDHAHPAWRLLTRIASHTLGYADASDPRLQAFVQQLDPWLAAVIADRAPGAARLSEALAALDALCVTHLRAEQKAHGSAIERLRRAGREEDAAARVRERIRADLSSAEAQTRLTPDLRELFLGPWCDAIGRIEVRDGESAPSVDRLSKLPRELVESLEPVRMPVQRAALLKRLPALAASLQEGLALSALPAERRQALTDELLVRHSEALSPSPRADAAPSPEDIVRRLREETVSPATDARLAPNTVIDESQLDTMPAEMLDSRSESTSMRWLAGAQPGLWCHLFLEGGWRSVRLIWVSDSHAHWLFASEPGRAHSLTSRAVERLAREGLLSPLEDRNLLERAIDGWLADTRRTPR